MKGVGRPRAGRLSHVPARHEKNIATDNDCGKRRKLEANHGKKFLENGPLGIFYRMGDVRRIRNGYLTLLTYDRTAGYIGPSAGGVREAGITGDPARKVGAVFGMVLQNGGSIAGL